MTNKMILAIIAVSHVWWLASCVGADPQINLLNEGCSQYNATSLSDFYTNLNATFLDLKAQLLNGSKHFATAQQAKGSDPVYAMTQCRNYLSSADCLSCFAAAVSQIRNCSASNGARVVYDGCFLRYVPHHSVILLNLLIRFQSTCMFIYRMLICILLSDGAQYSSY